MSEPLAWPDYLRQAMNAAGYRTATSLAKALTVNDSVVSRWLNGQSQTDVQMIRRLSPLLHVPVLDLLVAAGHIAPAEARMRDQPKPPEAPVGAGVDPELLAELAESRPDEIEKVRAFLLGIKAARN